MEHREIGYLPNRPVKRLIGGLVVVVFVLVGSSGVVDDWLLRLRGLTFSGYICGAKSPAGG